MLSLVNNHRKKIAASFLLLFYVDLIAPAIGAEPSPVYYHSTYGSSGMFTKDTFFGLKGRTSSIADAAERIKLQSIGNTNDGINLLNDPIVEKQDIDGPGQPEMKSFQSVNSDNMVDLFTGDFSYSIPLLDVGGYPVNLHYSSGITMDQEASWVGLGWNVNPGSVSRSMRGLPDDFDGKNDNITKTQSIKDNRTIGVSVDPSLEIWGRPINVSAKLGVFYNSYKGYGLETGAGIGATGNTAFGTMTTNLSISNNSQEGIRINPGLSFTFEDKESERNLKGSLGVSTGYSSRTGISSLQIDGGIQSDNFNSKKLLSAFGNGPLATISFARPAYTPSISMPISNNSFSFTGKVGGELWGTHASIGVTGYVNTQKIANEDTTQSIPAAGYLYSKYANGKENVLMDFNREKDMAFNYKTTPHIAIPQYTYDAFSISGEGIGGSFRPYRGDVGYVFDHNVASRSTSNTGFIDVGLGTVAHAGVEFNRVTSNSNNHRWNQRNNMESKLAFLDADTTFEPVYFRNPGEKTTNSEEYYRSIGDDSLIRIKLSGSKDHVYGDGAFVKYTDEGRPDQELPVTAPLVKKQRDRRTQVISYFTAEDAAILGLDKMIKSYPESDTLPIGDCSDSLSIAIPRVGGVRKKNHLSEISVLNSDGRKYVYGLPIYNVVQKDVSFAVAQPSTDDSTGKVAYTPGLDNTTNNNKGKDNYFSKEEMPAYAHNFLLTGILSPDYVDITGNGISEDDPGDAVKFNYTQVYGKNDTGYYRWRTPYAANSANYNEGFKTMDNDDKGTYMYGEKEMWYLHSIESKTMVAVFHTKSDRLDTYEVNGENGGVSSGKNTKRLDHINLYVKADLVKNGAAAKPVKTVHFSYNYELCKGALGDPDTGKLTLKKVWFTYNKNNKGQLNPYVFQYSPGNNGSPQADYNPSFNSRNSDRWGTYKSRNDNPGQMSNADFPYSIQDSAKAARNASMWNLTDIILPSGGKMKITYESDDYGYVQDKRATQMTMIEGINTPTGALLYSGKNEYHTFYVKTNEPLRNKADLRAKFLDLGDVLYFKLAVNMPRVDPSHPFEMVPGYGTIVDYGISPSDNTRFWVTLASVENRSPFIRAALQYLRLNLPSKAYPNSEGMNSLNLANVIKMLATSFNEVVNMVKGFDDAAKGKRWCQTINLSHSFVRLSNPNIKKYGGGYRVKQVQIYDNWKNMTAPANQRESVYGQEYIYTTTEEVNGIKKTISSGVASYEPIIGGEENPFRRPLNYIEKLAPMAPVNYMFSEEPLGESFFPSPMVGYSKVRVRTINAKARSANGWSETEYFTTKDFPTKVDHTLLQEGSSKFKYQTFSSIIRLNHKNFVTLSQGFRIELNDMNGKMKAQASYGEMDPVNPIAYTRNYYKVDNDKVTNQHLNNQVWAIDSTTGTINTNAQIGKDIEVMADMREQDSKTLNLGINPNVDVVPFLPVTAIPSMIKLPQREEVRYRSAAITKIVQRYGILDSVVVMDKGSVVSTKNIVYDAATGNVVLSRTNNEFNDPIYNFNYPAYWAYSGMGQAYKNIGAVFTGTVAKGNLQLNKGILFQTDNVRYPVERFFESGDEIYVYKANLATEGADCRYLTPTSATWTGRLWVISGEKGDDKNKGLYFIDSLGKVARNMIIEKMVITRSGKRNMTDVSAGNVVMLNTPVKQMLNGQYKIVIDSSTRVLNASAATFSDRWKVENSLYREDSCYTIVRPDTAIFRTEYDDGNTATFRDAVMVRRRSIRYHLGGIGNNDGWNYAASTTKVHNSGNGNSHFRFSARSVMKFNLAREINPTDSVVSATFYLNAAAPTRLWEGVSNNAVDHFQDKTKAHFVNGNLYQRTNSSNIRQVIAGWNVNTTGFDNLVTGNTSIALSATPDDTCINKTASVTSMVRDMVKNPSRNNGFVLTLDDVTGGVDNDQGSERTLAFCASSPIVKSFLPPNSCVNCMSSYLSVVYITSKDTCVKRCRNFIADTTNPYRWGITGNWRMERSFVYYNQREETDATIKNTDIRTEGTLKNFAPYWAFATEKLSPSQDSTRWVWNSAIAAFNRKGFEIENYDALGRFNAGLYGYNQTLPVAVAQNSRYRELLYDGFEDYGYKTKYCSDCPPEREFDFVGTNTGVALTQEQSHTGLYSIKVNSGSESLLTIKVDSIPPNSLLAPLDSTEITGLKIVGKGTGLNGAYYMGSISNGVCRAGRTATNRTDAGINFDWTSAPPITPTGPNPCTQAYSVTWTGTIQPKYTDVYRFYFRYNGKATIRVNGANIITNASNYGGERVSRPINLEAGALYPITIIYDKLVEPSPGPVILSWSGTTGQVKEIVPATALYPIYPPTTSDTAGSVTYPVQYYCPYGKDVTQSGMIRPVFSPFLNTKLTVSAWARLDVADCNATPALDSLIQVSFNTPGSSGTVWLKKTGQRIEGWQRYEANISVPANTSTSEMYLRLKTLASYGIYVDDIRVQPFNSSMKSFVYNPVNLRLMAELDENNYASFYEYDDDGTLIRVKKETERGIMTIQETRSALLKD